MHDSRDEFDRLIVRYLDGDMTAEESAALNEQFRSDPEARRRFIEHCRLASLVFELPAENPDANPMQIPMTTSAASQPGARRRRWVAFAAAAIIALAAGVILISITSQTGQPARSPVAPPVAMLSDLDGHLTFNGHANPTLGADLAPGMLSLTDGRAQVMFNSMAVVDLIAPSTFRTIDDNRGYLAAGRLHAYVPAGAAGFAVRIPHGVLIRDLGTEFDLDVDPAGQSRVDVLSGRIAIDRMMPGDPSTHSTELVAGQFATIVGSTPTVSPLIAPPLDPHSVTIDPVIFNAADNRVAAGDDPPGLTVDMTSSPLVTPGQRIGDAFGGSHSDVEPSVVLFANSGVPDNGNDIMGDGGETVDFIAWSTTKPIRLGGYRVILQSDQPGTVGQARSAGLVRFLVDGRVVDTYHVHGRSGSLLRVFTAGPITASHFRLELTRMTDGPNDAGPRVVEIDAVNAKPIDSPQPVPTPRP